MAEVGRAVRRHLADRVLLKGNVRCVEVYDVGISGERGATPSVRGSGARKTRVEFQQQIPLPGRRVYGKLLQPADAVVVEREDAATVLAWIASVRTRGAGARQGVRVVHVHRRRVDAGTVRVQGEETAG